MIEKFTGPGTEPTTIILLNSHSIKLPLNFYLYPHRLLQLSELVKEISLCSVWWLTQKLTTGQYKD